MEIQCKVHDDENIVKHKVMGVKAHYNGQNIVVTIFLNKKLCVFEL
jgi:hypothetical protein